MSRQRQRRAVGLKLVRALPRRAKAAILTAYWGIGRWETMIRRVGVLKLKKGKASERGGP